MGNSWFQFKQFTIQQGRAGMKVCTDSCLFGAYIPAGAYSKILDVGAGTGLLGLMLAQKCPESEIHFLESDPASFLDLKINVEQSPWKNRSHIHQGRLEDWAKKNENEKFDLVICNPPFFLQHLKSPNQSRNAALHLGLEEWQTWVATLKKLLQSKGRLWLLLPGNGIEEMLSFFLEDEMFIHEEVAIFQSGKPFRTIVGLSFDQSFTIKKAQLELRTPLGSLSNWALELMKDYYLEFPTPSS